MFLAKEGANCSLLYYIMAHFRDSDTQDHLSMLRSLSNNTTYDFAKEDNIYNDTSNFKRQGSLLELAQKIDKEEIIAWVSEMHTKPKDKYETHVLKKLIIASSD